ncbi:alpha/beta hydrolase [Paenibacillus sp. FSL R5-0519]|uniref:alpha/beta hydrolase n=1 Tax=Paenibacillus sp. FSL R5-0519 TaxID=2921648 RepID=UPI0030DAAD35
MNQKSETLEKRGKKTVKFVFLCILTFIVSFAGSVVFKMSYEPASFKKYSVAWNEEIGTVHKDLAYGEEDAQKFDLYVPADKTKNNYGLVVYLHAGGFTGGDKADDAKMLQWLASKGYVAAGINYTLFGENNPDANIYTQSMEIKDSMPYVIEEAKKLGYNIDEMAISGGSAGGTLALLYGYRDANTSPVPVRMVFEAVGPSSFYPEDWKSYGFDQNKEGAASLFSVMSGKQITPEMFGTAAYDETIKDISALQWVDKNTVPTVMAYGAHDKFQPYDGSVRLNDALNQYNVPHEYSVLEHSGHGLQNDNKKYLEYMQNVETYLEKYMPVKN